MIWRPTSVTALLLLLACTTAPSVPQPQLQALWDRPERGSITNAFISGGTVVFTQATYGGSQSEVETEALDIRTGAALWHRSHTTAVAGTAHLISDGSNVELVEARTGATQWQSKSVCPAPSDPTYATRIGSTVYVGCGGGALAALRESNGHTLARAHPAYLDDYDQIVALGDHALGVGGKASGAYMYRQSATSAATRVRTSLSLGQDMRYSARTAEPHSSTMFVAKEKKATRGPVRSSKFRSYPVKRCPHAICIRSGNSYRPITISRDPAWPSRSDMTSTLQPIPHFSDTI